MRSSKLEKTLERWLVEVIKRNHDGLCLKLWPISFTGLPDRLILLPGGRIIFCEVKREGMKPNLRQEYVHNKLRKLGFKVYWIDTLESFEKLRNDL